MTSKCTSLEVVAFCCSSSVHSVWTLHSSWSNVWQFQPWFRSFSPPTPYTRTWVRNGPSTLLPTVQTAITGEATGICQNTEFDAHLCSWFNANEFVKGALLLRSPYVCPQKVVAVANKAVSTLLWQHHRTSWLLILSGSQPLYEEWQYGRSIDDLKTTSCHQKNSSIIKNINKSSLLIILFLWSIHNVIVRNLWSFLVLGLLVVSSRAQT